MVNAMTPKPIDEATPTSEAGIRKLLDRARSGDESTLPALRNILTDPKAVDALGGDLARRARQTLVQKYAGSDILAREAISRKADSVRDELLGPNATALERLLAERIASNWLHLSHLEAVYAEKDGMSLTLGGYYQRSISAAQKRYLAAIKTLAQVRKLAVPVLMQVNVAEQQVNVAGVVDATHGERTDR